MYYSIFVEKLTLSKIYQAYRDMSILRELMKIVVKFSRIVISERIDRVVNFVSELLDFITSNAWEIVLTEKFDVLYFSENDKEIVNKIGIVYYAAYPLQIRLYSKYIRIASKNTNIFKRVIRRMSSQTARDVKLQLALL